MSLLRRPNSRKHIQSACLSGRMMRNVRDAIEERDKRAALTSALSDGRSSTRVFLDQQTGTWSVRRKGYKGTDAEEETQEHHQKQHRHRHHHHHDHHRKNGDDDDAGEDNDDDIGGDGDDGGPPHHRESGGKKTKHSTSAPSTPMSSGKRKKRVKTKKKSSLGKTNDEVGTLETKGEERSGHKKKKKSSKPSGLPTVAAANGSGGNDDGADSRDVKAGSPAKGSPLQLLRLKAGNKTRVKSLVDARSQDARYLKNVPAEVLRYASGRTGDAPLSSMKEEDEEDEEEDEEKPPRGLDVKGSRAAATSGTSRGSGTSVTSDSAEESPDADEDATTGNNKSSISTTATAASTATEKNKTNGEAPSSATVSINDDNKSVPEEEEEEEDPLVDDDEQTLLLPIGDGKYAKVKPTRRNSEPLCQSSMHALRILSSAHFQDEILRLSPTFADELDVPWMTAHAAAVRDGNPFAVLDGETAFPIFARLSAQECLGVAQVSRFMRELVAQYGKRKYCVDRNVHTTTRILICESGKDRVPWRVFSHEMEMLRDSTLADFQLLQTLGTGSFGRVRLAKHKKSNKFYAMKILKKAVLLAHEQQERIYWEKDIVSTVEHPFVVKFYRTFQDKDALYMLFEYAGGGEVFRLLCDYGRFEAKNAQFYAAQIILVLRYFHDLNIVYRDIKPENLLLDARGNLKFTDFGFASVIVPGTKAYSFLASAEYIAPEMILCKGYGLEVDMWSFGVLLYELLVGLPPFLGSLEEISLQIFTKEVEFPVEVDQVARDLIQRLLVLDPAKRYTPKQVMEHAFFKGIDWVQLYAGKLTAPFQPKLKHEGDTSHFNEYDEEDDPTPELDVDFEEF